MTDCTACVGTVGADPVPRWKAPLLFVAFLLFCPCHLPITFGVVAAAGIGLTGAAWLFGNQTLIYGVFSALYLVIVVLLLRWFVRHREREKLVEQAHAAHAE